MSSQVAEKNFSVGGGDGKLHVAFAGEGKSIVMLHGWTLDHRMWRPQLPLAHSHRLIMVDRRGYGQSTASADLVSEADDVEVFVDDYQFALVGFSQGATVAIDYARQHPERVSALILIGAPLHDIVPFDCESDEIPRRTYANLVSSGQLAQMKADWRQNPLVRVNPPARALLDEMLFDYAGRDLLSTLSRPTITHEDIAGLQMPVLAVAGVNDTLWRRRVAAFIGAIAPQGKLVLIEQAGHICNLDNPLKFNAILSEFLDTLPN